MTPRRNDIRVWRKGVTQASSNEGTKVNGNRLTAREHEVARLVARGWTNKEVARALGVTDGTVKLHMHKILQKLGEKNRYALYRRMRIASHLEGHDQDLDATK